MKKTLIICLLCYSSFLFAQHTSPLPAPTATPSSALKQLLLPTQDNDALRAAELQRRGPGIAPHFAKAIDVNIQPNSHGEWETLPDGSLVWRVRIASTGAYSLNLGFSSYQMPPNGTLLLYDSAAKEVVGPFSAMDNETHNQFWSPLVKTDELIVELWLPAEEKNDVSLTLNKINHDFMDWASILSGSCNLDVACGADDGWEIVDGYRDLIQSVGNYTAQGITSCTGFLINNTEGDCRPYFVTAFHCELTANNAPSMVVYWNFESPECRPVGSSASGGNGNGSLALFNSGATYRAGYAPSDMVLVELDDPVNEDADAFYVGWTREETLAQDTIIAIHHPNGEEKRISFAFDGVYRGQWGAGAAAIPDGNHVIVADWAIGTTEGGSSGCPLFNDDKQVIGQLHGGAASCFNDAYDSFGWFTTSWDGGGTASTSLRSWLDPNGSGVPTLRGRSQASCGFALLTEETIINICANSSASLTINTPSSFTAPLDLSFGDVPAGLNIVPSSSTLEGGTSTQIEFLTDAAITPGNYSITVNGLNGLEGTSLLLTIIIEDQLPEPETLSPADGINNSPSAIDFFWSELVPGRAYDLQVSTSSDFSTLVYDLSNQITMPIRLQFQPNDTYHWRVKGTNDCGEGGWSSVATFSTAPITCIDKQASDLPITISTSGTPTVVSTLPLEESSTVASVKVLNLNIEHSWVGDLEVSLTSPSSTIVPLIDRPGIPESNFGCDGNNILVDLFDDASETADDLDLICENTTPTIEGQFQPVSPLDVIIGEPAGGNWTLTIQDNADDDGGVLRNWTLELCTVQGGDRSLGLDLPRLTSCQGDPSNISLNIGADFDAAGIDLSIANLPSGVNADFSTNPALPGQSVQLSLNGEVAPGVYYLQLVGADGSTTSSSTLIWEVQAIPADLDLLQPVDDAPNVLAGTFLNWTASARAQNYRVELATDPAMQNVLWEETTEETFAILPDIVLDAATYWQVTAFNDCGNTISPVFSFNSVVDQLFEVTAQPLEVFPNPTTGRVQIKLPTVNGKVKLSIFNTSGQSMRELVLENALPVQEVDLSAFANGVYWLRLTDGQDLWYSKIMLIRE